MIFYSPPASSVVIDTFSNVFCPSFLPVLIFHSTHILVLLLWRTATNYYR